MQYNNIVTKQEKLLSVLKSRYKEILTKYGTKSLLTRSDSEEYLLTLKNEGITILYYKSPISEGIDINHKYGYNCLNFVISEFSLELEIFAKTLDKLEQYIFDNYGNKK